MQEKIQRAIHFGAGSIGRGFIGHLLFESGFHTRFIDVNQPVISALNKNKAYPLQLINGKNEILINIKNVSGFFSNEIDKIEKEFLKTDWVSTAVGVRILPLIAGVITKGIKARYERKINTPLNIIICENQYNVSKYLYELVVNEVDKKLKNYIDRHIGFVDTVIARMVPVFDQKFLKKNSAAAKAEPYNVLPVNKISVKGEIPRIRGLVPVDHFEKYYARKLYIHNAGHAITSYLGFKKKYKFIYEAIADQEIYNKVLYILEQSAKALHIKYKLDLVGLHENIYDLLSRFGNKKLGDTIERVSRDPLRKLSRKDRLIGTALLLLKNNPDEDINYLLQAICAAINFNHTADEYSQKLQLELQEKGIDYILKQYCNLKESEKLFVLIKKTFKKN